MDDWTALSSHADNLKWSEGSEGIATWISKNISALKNRLKVGSYDIYLWYWIFNIRFNTFSMA